MPESRVKDTVQAALMVSGDALSVDALIKLFDAKDRPSRAEVSAALSELEGECDGRSFSLVKVASGWRYQINQDFSAMVGRLWEQRPPRYSQALMETLALIVYRQPITRGEIEKVRGVAPSTNIMQTLTERNWVRVVGYKPVPGRPALYGTTREFLDYFGLKSLKDLPLLPEPRAKEDVESQTQTEEAGASESGAAAADAPEGDVLPVAGGDEAIEPQIPIAEAPPTESDDSMPEAPEEWVPPEPAGDSD